jgi:hypothetical protein
MAYDLSVVRENVRNKLDDDEYEQTFLDRAINYAQWEITNRHHLSFMEASQPLTVNQGDLDASLPTDFHEYLHLLITSPTNVRANITEQYLDYEDFLNNYIVPAVNPQNRPYWWSEYGRKIKFANPADQTYTLLLDYLRSSAKLVDDTDVPDIPEEFSELLEIGAYMRINKREDDYDVKSAEQMDYQALLTDFLHVYGRKKRPGGMRKMRVS